MMNKSNSLLDLFFHFQPIVMRMKFPYYLLGVILLLSNIACQPEKVESKQAEVEDTVKPTNETPTTSQKTPTIWYSPRVLTQRLGDLSEKTVANIGAGPYGNFSIQIADEAKKVIAIDIDPKAINFIDSMRQIVLPLGAQDKLETRLVEPDDPKLRFEEADVITIRETYAYISNRITYLKTLKRGLKDGGKLLIVDYKMRRLPIGPPASEKVPLFQVELDLEEAGYRIEFVDDNSLAYQYIIIATKG